MRNRLPLTSGRQRLFVIATALLIAGYLSSATAAWLFWRRNSQNQVGWVDIVLAPIRWEEFRRKRGDTAIFGALEALRAGKVVEGLHGLRVGLARAPANVQGRLALAQLYVATKPAHALAILEAGIPHSRDNPDFLRALFALYIQQGAHARAIEQARRLQAPTRPEFLSPAQSIRLRLPSLLSLQRVTEAKVELDAHAANLSPLDCALARAGIALAAKDTSAFSEAIAAVLAARPEDPAAHLFAVRGWIELQQPIERDRAVDRFLTQFDSHEKALHLLAATAAGFGADEILARTKAAAEHHGFAVFPFLVHETEIALRIHDFAGALNRANEWRPRLHSMDTPSRRYPVFIAELARAAVPGEDTMATGLLRELADAHPVRNPGELTFAAQILRAAGRVAPAEEVIEIAARFYPYNDAVAAAQRMGGAK